MSEDDEKINDLEKIDKTTFRIWQEKGKWRGEVEPLKQRLSKKYWNHFAKKKGYNKEVEIL